MIILVVTGGRDFSNEEFVDKTLDAIHDEYRISLLVEGGATGLDRLAREWAIRNKVLVRTENADWDNLDAPGAVIRYNRYGNPYNAKAGTDRNALMLDKWKPDRAAVFPGGSGTANMLWNIKRRNIPYEIYNDKTRL